MLFRSASLEIYSDVHMEYQSFLSLLTLLPYAISDIKESITALITQQLTENIISADQISEVIPHNHRASLLSVHIYPTIEGNKFFIKVAIPEFHRPYTVYSINTIPFNPTKDGIYTALNIKNPVIAANPDGETFVYNPSICVTHQTIDI